jgi:carboxypeptidase C (cathepsin A)
MEDFKKQGDFEYEDFGKLKRFKKLSFLQVYRAGHMVPMDKPEEALHMINDWIRAGVTVVTLWALTGRAYLALICVDTPD